MFEAHASNTYGGTDANGMAIRPDTDAYFSLAAVSAIRLP